MPYLSAAELREKGFKHLGIGIKISSLAAFYECEKISVGDHSRIDDFCVISGNVTIGRMCHVTPQCLVSGGIPGVFLEDYVTLAYGVKVFSQSDDYSGETMTNSLVPKKYKREIFASVRLGKYSIVGAGSIIFPGADLAEGVAVGALSLVLKKTEPWKIYGGVPAKILKDRSRTLLNFSEKLEAEINDTV